jgi:PhnB protein
MTQPKLPAAPDGYNTVNPFIITDNAGEVLSFIKDVFGGIKQPDATTYDTDGLLLHSEVRIGNAIVQVADRKPDWPATPGLLQVYVDDVASALDKAVSHGAVIVTKPTDFMGAILSRVKDAQNNIWWIYQYTGEVDWGEATATPAEPGQDTGNEQSWEPSKEAIYIHDTLLEAMRSLHSK